MSGSNALAIADRQAFFEQMKRAGAAGKGWWVDLQIRQIEETIWHKKQIEALVEALEMVRDADEDCRKDGLPAIPPEARAKIDEALATSHMAVDPKAVSFALGVSA
jgi:hypothetical protein